MNLNIWVWPLPKKQYFLRPWEWFRQLSRNLKKAQQRARKGYCVYDWADFNDWYCAIIPQMLREMADNGKAYPANKQFNTPEKWREWLYDIANKIEYATKEDISRNEYKKEYQEILENARQRANAGEEISFTAKEKIVRSKYWTREKEIVEEQKDLFKEVMRELIDNFDFLWD